MKKKNRKIKRRKSTEALEFLNEAENQRLLSEISSTGGMAASAAIRAKQAEEKAKELLKLDNPIELGAGNEVIPPEPADPREDEFYEIRETLKAGASSINFDASCARMELLKALDCLAMGFDAAHSIDAKNSLEKMLVHQAAVCHSQAMQSFFQAQEISYRQFDYINNQKKNIDMQCKLVNSSIRLMKTYDQKLQTLLKLRANGKPSIEIDLGSDPVIVAVRELMNEIEIWQSSPSDLLVALEKYVPEKIQKSKKWPKRAHVLSGKLKRFSFFLRTAGIEVITDIKEGKGKRKIIIRKIIGNGALCATHEENN